MLFDTSEIAASLRTVEEDYADAELVATDGQAAGVPGHNRVSSAEGFRTPVEIRGVGTCHQPRVAKRDAREMHRAIRTDLGLTHLRPKKKGSR